MKLSTQFFRFCIAGGINTAINYVTFYVFLVLVGVNYLLSGALGFSFAVIPAFLMNRAWTFSSQVSFWRGFPVYLPISVFTLGLHSITQWFAVEVFGVIEIFSQLFGIAVATVVNFLLVRRLVFGKAEQNSTSPQYAPRI